MKIKIPRYARNFYFVAGVLFLFWMVFIDSNSVYNQYQLTRKLNKLQNQEGYYYEKIDEVKKDREELLSNPELLEKFAREKYLMKKPSEDIYIIVEE